jgi:hypothetical protein
LSGTPAPRAWVNFPTGSFIHPPMTRTSQSSSSGKRSWHPIIIPHDMTLDALSFRVEASGTIGSLTRVGLYDDADGYPGDLILDAGNSASDVVASIVADITPVVVPAGLYWMVAHTTIASGTLMCGIHTAMPHGLLGGFPQSSVRPGTSHSSGYIEANITPDVLPATAPSDMSRGRFPTYVAARVG